MRRCALVALIATLALPASAAPASAEVVWVCKPDLARNICLEDLTTRVFAADGSSRVQPAPIPRNPPVDCFYVYPTVSNQPGPNASETVEPEVEGIVRLQGARFSRQCRVFAPVYRQVTVPALLARAGSAESERIAYADVLEAWREYLARHNRGRGFVLIGHSQGTTMLRRLLRREIDPSPALRRRLVSALLPGQNASTRKGSLTGGDFRRVPACTSASEISCVIAYSIYNEPPPANSRYGRAHTAPDPESGDPGGPDLEAICTNPASLDANADSELHFLLPSRPFPPGFIALSLMQVFNGSPPSADTPWLRPRDRYAGRCVRQNGAHVLLIRALGDSERLTPSPDRSWGLHLVDVNLAFGDLQRVVARQSRAYVRSLGRPRLSLRLRFRRARDSRGRRCAPKPVRMALRGADRRQVARADFRRNRALLRRDRTRPFGMRVGRSRLPRGKAVRFGVRAVLRDGRSRRIFRRARICA